MSLTGERIKSLRLQKNMSQSDLAAKLRIGRSNMGHIENGRVEPTKESIVQLSEIFDVTTDYLLGLTDFPKPVKSTDRIPDDLDRMLDNAMTFGGKPLTEKDREAIRAYIEGRKSLD